MAKKTPINIDTVARLAEELGHALTGSTDDLSPADASRLQRELVLLQRDAVNVAVRLYVNIRSVGRPNA